MASVLGVAVASAATDSVEAEVSTAATLGSSSLGFFEFVRRHHPIRILGFGRHFLGQFRFLDLGLLLGQRRRSDRRIGVRTGRQIGGFKVRRFHLQSDLDRGCAQRIVGIVVLQMRDRQRYAADMKCERSQGRENPQPPGRFLLRVEVGHLALAGAQGLGLCGAGGDCAASGTPSSATSLIFE